MIVGLVFTGINPFFLIWWATVDSLLIAQALLLGAFVGVFIMFAAHIWLDYVWLGGTAGLTARGRSFLGKWYKILLIAFGIGMLFFGTEFIISRPIITQGCRASAMLRSSSRQTLGVFPTILRIEKVGLSVSRLLGPNPSCPSCAS